MNNKKERYIQFDWIQIISHLSKTGKKLLYNICQIHFISICNLSVSFYQYLLSLFFTIYSLYSLVSLFIWVSVIFVFKIFFFVLRLAKKLWSEKFFHWNFITLRMRHIVLNSRTNQWIQMADVHTRHETKLVLLRFFQSNKYIFANRTFVFVFFESDVLIIILLHFISTCISITSY